MSKRLQKRRRVSSDSSSQSVDTNAFAGSSSPVPRSSLAPTVILTDGIASSCISCHRALIFSSAGPAKQNQAFECERCRSFMCSICSRKCTAVPPSISPTPSLSFSPSPPGSPARLELESSRHGRLKGRIAAHAMVQGELGSIEEETKMQLSNRRRQRDEDEEDERTVVGADDQFGSDSKLLGAEGSGKAEGGLLSGCGRTVCKDCSVESLQTGHTTCFDCYGLPPPSSLGIYRTTFSNNNSSYPSTNTSTTSLLT